MDVAKQEKVLAVARAGMTSAEAIGFFRVALGLYYLAGLMTPEALDFKKIDADYNRFIYRSIGGGHSITSALQFMSGEKVLAVLDSPRFAAALAQYCPEITAESIPFLLSLNLGVAKDISRIPVDGPVADWIARHQAAEGDAAAAQPAAADRPAAADPASAAAPVAATEAVVDAPAADAAAPSRPSTAG